MIRRREFIRLLGGAAAAWPLAARAQQAGMPVIGPLTTFSPEHMADYLAAFRKGLSETGYIEGRNVAIEYRWARNDYGGLQELVADLVRRRVAVIVITPDVPSVLAAKAATTTIPIVFYTGGDPVSLGLVASLNRPGGNVTGLGSMNTELMPKRLGILQELLPGATRLAMLIDPRVISFSAMAVQAAASNIGRQIEVFAVRDDREIDAAFATLVQKRIEALLITPQPLFGNRRTHLVTLATHYRLPTIYYARDFVDAGGLMSYGTNITDQHRQLGVYTARILKGDKPADLPVIQSAKFEFVINLHTAKLLGIKVPATLLATADELIE
jgi:putative ABC transport system substrate-binding protein